MKEKMIDGVPPREPEREPKGASGVFFAADTSRRGHADLTAMIKPLRVASWLRHSCVALMLCSAATVSSLSSAQETATGSRRPASDSRINLDPRTNGAGFARLRDARIMVDHGIGAEAARRTIAGFLTRRTRGRPHVTLKLALSLDGAVAMASGSSQWITGAEARAHAHIERSRHEAILVGRGTWQADRPRLDVRLAGLESRAPRRVLLSTGHAPEPGVTVIAAPGDIATLDGIDHVMVEGGATTAAAFLAADLVDRLLLYRAPILVGGGRTLPDIGLADLAEAHGRWHLLDARPLGSDRVEVYERRRNGI